MGASGESGRRRQIAFFGYWAFIVLSVPMTNSRAGLVFALLVSAIVAWSFLRGVGTRWKWLAALAIAAAVPAIFYAPIPVQLIGRFGGVADDVRWPILAHSLQVWRQFWMFGAGLGSFVDVYMTFEKREWLIPTYVNNVHNDFVQLGIELGVAGLLSLALFTVGIIMSLVKGLRTTGSGARVTALMGFAIVLAFAIHSLVDYPLRRPAAIIIFLVGTAAIFRAARADVPTVDYNRGSLSGERGMHLKHA
jgi:O-antigen ligase